VSDDKKPDLPAKDVGIVRELAKQCMELATSDEYQARRKRWRDVNERRKPDRAPVWCRPAGVWKEILTPDDLQCTDSFCRGVEYSFRQHLYKHWVGDDHIFEPWWGVGAAWGCDSEYTWGVPVRQSTGSTEFGGFRYNVPLESVEDYEKVTIPSFTYNKERTEQAVCRMQDLFGDSMPVQRTCGVPVSPMHNVYLEQLRGMANMLEDLAFHPEHVHRCMAKITEANFRAMRAAEDTGLLTPNHHGPMTCSDPVNGVPADGEVRLHNLWCGANSQEFQVVSPWMQEEFLLNYQIPIFQQYGAVQYGCCEDLTQKIDILLRIPNLRVFVCSAWTDLDKVLEKCGKDYTIMWRQSAADVIFTDDLDSIRKHLDEGLRKLQGHHYQVVLREVQTLHGQPNRIQEWAQIAIELAEKHA